LAAERIKMKTGFARVCITPPMGVSISGYYEPRTVKGVLDDLYLSAVAFDDGKRKALIVAADVLMLSYAQCNEYKAAISAATDVCRDAIFINCSHTHTGPYLNGERFGDEEVCPEYVSEFEEKIVAVCKDAFVDMRESDTSVGVGYAKGISFVRRFRMKTGGAATNPGIDNPDVAEALGVPNEEVKLLRIDRAGGEGIVIVSFGTHADTVGGELVSADWPGFVRSTLEGALEGVKCVFLTACQGDVNHINPRPTERDRRGLDYDTFDGVPRGYEHAKHMGRTVAAAVLSEYGKARPIRTDKISFDTLEIAIPANSENGRYGEALEIKRLHAEGRDNELPYEKMELTTVVAEAYRIVELYDGPGEFRFVLSGLCIGEAVFLGIPGECFVDIGRRIEAESSFDTTLVCCLTNGGETYFPTSSAYDEGGYEARSSRLKKGGDGIVVENTVALCRRLK